MQVYGASAANDEYEPLYAQCKATPGMRYRGSVSQSELARELAGATILAYPNTFAETGCIAAMEAWPQGCWSCRAIWGRCPKLAAAGRD